MRWSRWKHVATECASGTSRVRTFNSTRKPSKCRHLAPFFQAFCRAVWSPPQKCRRTAIGKLACDDFPTSDGYLWLLQYKKTVNKFNHRNVMIPTRIWFQAQPPTCHDFWFSHLGFSPTSIVNHHSPSQISLCLINLIGGFKHGFYVPFHIWYVILPIDELHSCFKMAKLHQPVMILTIHWIHWIS